jgi:copper resistance protein D
VSPDVVAVVLVQWTSLAALAALVGSLVLSVLVLPADAPGSLRLRLARWSRLGAAVFLVAGAGELVLRARTMGGGDLSTALAVVPSVLTGTHFGRIWSARAVALGLLMVAAGRGGAVSRGATLCLAFAVALSMSLVGHAADQGDLSVATLIDWLHVSAAATWTGGLFCLAVLVLPGTRIWPRDRLEALVLRFSALAGWCLAAVVASGICNGWIEIGSIHALWTTTYGQILAMKLALVLAIVVLGAANRYAIIPRLVAGGAGAAARLATSVAWEAALGLVVLGCTALLTQSAPPRHRDHVAGTWTVTRCWAIASHPPRLL